MDSDLERKLAATPAVPLITSAQCEYLTDLLDQLDLTLEEAIVDCNANGDGTFADDDWPEDVNDLTKAEASCLIAHLAQLRHERRAGQ